MTWGLTSHKQSYLQKSKMNCHYESMRFLSDTNHMIMMTSFITISLRMLKNSIMSLAFSPILPMQMPNAIKKPIRPVTKQNINPQLLIPVWTGEMTTKHLALGGEVFYICRQKTSGLSRCLLLCNYVALKMKSCSLFLAMLAASWW